MPLTPRTTQPGQPARATPAVVLRAVANGPSCTVPRSDGATPTPLWLAVTLSSVAARNGPRSRSPTPLSATVSVSTVTVPPTNTTPTVFAAALTVRRVTLLSPVALSPQPLPLNAVPSALSVLVSPIETPHRCGAVGVPRSAKVLPVAVTVLDEYRRYGRCSVTGAGAPPGSTARTVTPAKVVVAAEPAR